MEYRYISFLFYFWCDGIVTCVVIQRERSSSFVINIQRGANRYIRTSLPPISWLFCSLQHTIIQHATATMLYSLHQMVQYYIQHSSTFSGIFEPFRVELTRLLVLLLAASSSSRPGRARAQMLKTMCSNTEICIQDRVQYYSAVYYIACIAPPDAIDAICYGTSKPPTSSKIRPLKTKTKHLQTPPNTSKSGGGCKNW